MLCPGGGAKIEMHVSGPQTEPIHCGQMADRIARMSVRNELRTGRRTGGEVQEQKIVCASRYTRKPLGGFIRLLVRNPPARAFPDGYPHGCAGDLREAPGEMPVCYAS